MQFVCHWLDSLVVVIYVTYNHTVSKIVRDREGVALMRLKVKFILHSSQVHFKTELTPFSISVRAKHFKHFGKLKEMSIMRKS